MIRSWRVRALIALAALAVVMVPAAAGATNSWGGYHWARTTTNPFTVKLGNNVSSNWYPYLVATSADWSSAKSPSPAGTTIVAGGTSPKSCKATSGQVRVCSAGYGNTGWLGVAQIWVSGLHITQGTVKVNDTYFNTATYNTKGWRSLVMCQEVGHTLGLDHQDTNFNNPNLGTCMDYTSDPTAFCSQASVGSVCNPVQDNEQPNQHDYDELGIIYNHTDSFTTLNATAPSARGAFDTPGQWGHRVAGSNDPHSVAVYENDLGSGQRLVTFVVWAG